MQAKISPGNIKLGGIPFVSLIPIKDCANCEACQKSCYALKSYRMYEDVRRAWHQNSRAVHSKGRIKWFNEIDQHIAKKRPRYFRWHVAGDIPDQHYYEGMKIVAQRNPNTKFVCFTKNFDLDFGGRPHNLAVILSMYPTMKTPRKKMPRAWMQDGTETRIPKDAIECSGHCEGCNVCWDLNKMKKDVYFHKY